MKYFAFALATLIGIPLMALAAAWSKRLHDLLIITLVISPMAGDAASINFVSREAYRGPDRGFEVALTDLIAVALGFALLLQRKRRLRWLLPGLIPMGGLFLVSALSTLSAPEPLFATFTLFKGLRFVVVFWVAANIAIESSGLAAMRRGWTMVGLIALLVTLKQKYLDGIYRIPLLFDHSNTVPLFLNLVAPTLLLLAVADRRIGRNEAAISSFAAFGMVVTVAMTYSRAGTALAILSILAVLAVALIKAPGSRSFGLTVLVLAALTAGAAMTADSIIDRIENAPESSAHARDEFNHAASLMVADHPFGIGLNNFSKVLSESPRYNQHLDVMANEAQAGVVHHVYWLTVAELGWPGLLLFITVLVRLQLTSLWHGFRGRSTEHLALIGAGIGFAAVNAAGLLEWALRISPVTLQFALVSGLVAACVRPTRAPQPYRS